MRFLNSLLAWAAPMRAGNRRPSSADAENHLLAYFWLVGGIGSDVVRARNFRKLLKARFLSADIGALAGQIVSAVRSTLPVCIDEVSENLSRHVDILLMTKFNKSLRT